MKHRCNNCDTGHYARNYYGEMRCDTCGYKPNERCVQVSVVPVCVPAYTFTFYTIPTPPIQWVIVQFDSSYKDYSYLCDIQDVEAGDNLVVHTVYGYKVVECMSVHRDTPPSWATKSILDKTVK